MELLEFVLNKTYFMLRVQVYQQKLGTTKASPVSPIVANLFIGSLEQKAISTPTEECRPHFWKGYVDDTLEVIKKGKAKMLTEHSNQVDNTGSI